MFIISSRGNCDGGERQIDRQTHRYTHIHTHIHTEEDRDRETEIE